MLIPDYSIYELEELLEALDTIDSEAYPENHTLLLKEIARRGHQQQDAKINESEPPPTIIQAEISDPHRIKKDQKSIIQLIIQIKLSIIIGVLCLPAYFYTYLINEQYNDIFKFIAWIAATATFVGCIIYLYRTDGIHDSAHTQMIKKQAASSKTLIVVFSPFLAICAYFLTLKGFPILVHTYLIDSHKALNIVTVSKKNYSYHKKYCHGKVHFKEYQYATFDYVCSGISESKWKKLSVGNKLHLVGTQSKIGFLKQRVIKITK